MVKAKSLFEGLSFVIDEDDLLPKKFISQYIKKNSGDVLKRFTKKTTHFISTMENYLKKTRNVSKAIRLNVKVVSTDFIFKSLRDKKIPKLCTEFRVICNKKDILKRKMVRNQKTAIIKLKKNRVIVNERRNRNSKLLSKALSHKDTNSAQIDFLKNQQNFLKEGYHSFKRTKRSKSQPKNNFSIFKRNHKIQRTKSVSPERNLKQFLTNTDFNDENNADEIIEKDVNKALSWKSFQKHILSFKDSLINPSNDLILFKPENLADKILYEETINKEKCSQCEKRLYIFKEKRMTKLEEVFIKGKIVFQEELDSSSGIVKNSEIFIRKNKELAKEKFSSICNKLSKNGGKLFKTESGMNKVFTSKRDFEKVWWRNNSLTKRVLEKKGIHLFKRVKFNSYVDFESIEDIILMDQIEISLLRSGILKHLIKAYNDSEENEITYNHLSQKYSSVKLLFDYGHLIGFILGDFVQFYHFPEDIIKKENIIKPETDRRIEVKKRKKPILDSLRAKNRKREVKPKAQLMSFVNFEYDKNNENGGKVFGYVFEEDSANIKFQVDGSSENKKFEILRKAMYGEAHVVI